MKSGLISIQPQWCELIAKGKKTVEVRKTRPQLGTPFKVYIYCTKGHFHKDYSDTAKDWKANALGKVIGEFVCDRIDCTTKDNIKVISEASCVPVPDLWEYGRKSSAYGLYCWHISDLVIYEKPKELSEFTKPYGTIVRAFDSPYIQRPPQSWFYVEELNDGA